MMTSTAPRITARIDVQTQDLLKEAAQLAGISSINSFVLQAALKEAKAIIAQEQTIKLSQEASLRLIDALNNPPEPNQKLRQLFQTGFNEMSVYER